MRTRLKYTIILTVLFLITVPLITQAQEGLTLESLAEQFAGLVERVATLEKLSEKPTLEITETGCILIQYHEEDQDFPSISAPLIQDKTYLSYRKKFNRNLESLDIIRVDYRHEGGVVIYYSDSNNDVVVAEVFAGCEFLDHTDWNPQ